MIAGLIGLMLLGRSMPLMERRYLLGAVAALAVAFVSPLCALSVALFSARAVHHLLLVGVAAPLLAAAAGRRVRVGMATGLAAGTASLWLWHVPALYDAALADKALYWAMQVTLLAGAWAFWRAVFVAAPAVAAAGIAGGAAQMGMLGAILSFAPRPLYASHLATTVPYGMGPLGDQQLAGLLMWVVGLLPYAVAAGWLGRRGWHRLSPGVPT
ncbi:cytochrome c oxidase assembly protein [Sphingomonas carotinifaciens]|uniref:cytochrome c oxidase assembly protein n=1 Tax=Sphingomonas carotinifaciens TaxID=1166323 RepID=UPI001F3DFFE7|nr:cytochrome c oxidase assembly protein [Sphingomonas carotinifaciens]